MTTPQSKASRCALALKQANEKPNPSTILAGERLISRAELREFVTASDMALWRWLKTGKFPPPVYIGTRRFWKATDISRWLEYKRTSEVQHGSAS
jgi:predicted DNA-binding transcriptional regulator AlpA